MNCNTCSDTGKVWSIFYREPPLFQEDSRGTVNPFGTTGFTARVDCPTCKGKEEPEPWPPLESATGPGFRVRPEIKELLERVEVRFAREQVAAMTCILALEEELETVRADKENL